jgi:hypothetical protein
VAASSHSYLVSHSESDQCVVFSPRDYFCVRAVEKYESLTGVSIKFDRIFVHSVFGKL